MLLAVPEQPRPPHVKPQIFASRPPVLYTGQGSRLELASMCVAMPVTQTVQASGPIRSQARSSHHAGGAVMNRPMTQLLAILAALLLWVPPVQAAMFWDAEPEPGLQGWTLLGCQAIDL